MRAGDELHILVRGEVREEVEELTERWTKGPLGRPPPPPLPRRAASQVFTVRPASGAPDPRTLTELDGIPVLAVLRSRGDGVGAMLALADGRYAVLGEDLVAVGGRRVLADWCEGRAERKGVDQAERAWWQEVTGALIARGRP
jgi:hypothetical protein